MQKKSFLIRLRNYFITGALVLIPIGVSVYLTLFIIKVSSKILPKGLNPNTYLLRDIPGVEIIVSIILITIIGWLSLSFLGKKIIQIIDNFIKSKFKRSVLSPETDKEEESKEDKINSKSPMRKKQT
mgnify:CR=1 FL=1